MYLKYANYNVHMNIPITEARRPLFLSQKKILATANNVHVNMVIFSLIFRV